MTFSSWMTAPPTVRGSRPVRVARFISHTVNMGIGAAIRTAIRHAIEKQYDILVVVSGTGKTPARYVPDLIRPIAREL